MFTTRYEIRPDGTRHKFEVRIIDDRLDVTIRSTKVRTFLEAIEFICGYKTKTKKAQRSTQKTVKKVRSSKTLART